SAPPVEAEVRLSGSAADPTPAAPVAPPAEPAPIAPHSAPLVEAGAGRTRSEADAFRRIREMLARPPGVHHESPPVARIPPVADAAAATAAMPFDETLLQR